MSWILIKAGFKRDELIHLVEEMIRQSSIQAVVRLMLPALTQVYSEEAKTQKRCKQNNKDPSSLV